ncbi:MFS transporter [Arthrobacter sp. UM1]|uniref:MFS transporter n=1 Tax=Arthrobacter sp. UM1 TaxID=2766776 RepID=UPI001CF62524|nr:MFS transporter [Arthrobacter sp. UM1]MCB4208806.1 MFS transporter [Arthrobacter sp. UM1]
MTEEEQALPLSRNRNYTILWSSRFVSEVAAEIAYLAFPLIILSTTGSPWELGAVASVHGAAQILGVIPAGLLADTLSRKVIMLLTELLRFAVLGSFAMVLVIGGYSFPVLILVAALEGALASAFAPAEDAALPSVVGKSQLVAALARNTSRTYLAALLGPAVCGVLFAVHTALPFVVDTGVIGLSLFALALLRLPSNGRSESAMTKDDGSDLSREGSSWSGITWVLKHSGLRATILWIGSSQLLTTGLVVVVLSQAGENNTSAGGIGIMMTFYGAGGLLGSLAAERLHRLMRPSVVIIGFSWLLVTLVAAMTLVPADIFLGILLGLVAFFVPTAFTTVMGYQLLVTPDELRGRLSGLTGVATGLATTAGPLLGAVLVSTRGVVSPFAAAAGGLAIVAVASTVSPTIRRISKLTAHQPTTTGAVAETHNGTTKDMERP